MLPQEIVNEAVKALDDRSAKDIVVLEVGELTSLGEYFIVASANNTTQVRALANHVEEILKDKGEVPLYVEQKERGSQWILIDYGAVMIHIFYQETREFYALERLWEDAKHQDVSVILNEK